MEKNLISGIIILVILVLLLVGSIVWYVIINDQLIQCRNSESNLCPVFYCGNIRKEGSMYGKPGTKCVNDNSTEQEIRDLSYRAYRYDKDGNLQCQNYNMPLNVINPEFDFNKCKTAECFDLRTFN